MKTPFYEYAIVTAARQSPEIANLPKGAAVEKVTTYVLTAFDAGLTMEIGYDADNDAYGTGSSIATTGRKSHTLGAGVGHDATARTAKAYVKGGTATVGRAFSVIEGYILPSSI